MTAARQAALDRVYVADTAYKDLRDQVRSFGDVPMPRLARRRDAAERELEQAWAAYFETLEGFELEL